MSNLKTIVRVLAFAGLIASAVGQDISIPDPGLNAAFHDALQKPIGPLTAQDLLSLTNLQATSRNITNVAGLEAARNLVTLNLFHNHLASFSLPSELTNLTFLDLSFNALTNCSIPSGVTNLTTLNLGDNRLTNLNLPLNLSGLTNLNLEDNGFASFKLPSYLTNLVFLNVGFNSLTNCSLPAGLTNLTTLIVAGNLLTNFTLPGDAVRLGSLDVHINSLTNFTVPASLTRLTNLDVNENSLVGFTVPAGMTNLALLDLSFNQLTNLALPPDLRSLTDLDLDFNQLANLNLPPGLTNLGQLHLRANQFTDFSLPAGLTALSYLDISEGPLSHLTLPLGLNHLTALRLSKNNLTNLILPVGMTNLVGLNLSENQLTNIVLPPDLNHLKTLNLSGNQLTSVNLPVGLTGLTGLFLVANQLTTITLPPDLTQLNSLGFLSNPLATFVLSEPLSASTNLTDTIAALETQGVSVSTYPLTVQLIAPRETPAGAFEFAVTGPPGVYTVLASTDLSAWTSLGSLTNQTGTARFIDLTSALSPQKFYRALSQTVPTNMVFIAANTFTLGSPTGEVGHRTDEEPQTTVTLTHGFWISKFLVTQRDYLAVVGSNPSGFPGDLNRPVESVSWFAASNYCALLTQQDLAAARIPSGTHYRLPTEAEWECAARAGTSTRFYYGDDPGVTSLTNHAWYGANSGLTTRPVGLKQPNAWGLYDMEGNVWEWCQDWYGPYPGGSVADPQGPASNQTGFKVIRGGAWESFETDCRSARRSIEGASPFISDFIIGFRVVLVTDP